MQQFVSWGAKNLSYLLFIIFFTFQDRTSLCRRLHEGDTTLENVLDFGDGFVWNINLIIVNQH